MPKSFLVAFALALAMSPALAAAPCDRWSFDRIPEEEGMAPVAFVCAPGEAHSLKLSCSADGAFWLAWYPAGSTPDHEPGYKGRLVIDIGDDTFRRPVLLQAMDNALIVDGQKLSGPLIAAMQSGRQMALRLEDGSAATETFPLAGSTAALKSLATACKAIW